MKKQRRKQFGAIGLLLTLVASQTYVQANLAVTNANHVDSGQGGDQLSGRLVTRGNNPITVNGNSARSGDTIFSGAQIQSPSGVGATVQLSPLGSVDIAPNTSLRLTFEAKRITVNLTQGCLILRSNRGVVGTINTPQGTSEQTKGSEASSISIDICLGGAGATIVGQGAASAADAGASSVAATTAASSDGAGLFGLGTIGTIGFFGAATEIVAAAMIAVPCRRGANPSPGVPGGPNAVCR